MWNFLLGKKSVYQIFNSMFSMFTGLIVERCVTFSCGRWQAYIFGKLLTTDCDNPSDLFDLVVASKPCPGNPDFVHISDNRSPRCPGIVSEKIVRCEKCYLHRKAILKRLSRSRLGSQQRKRSATEGPASTDVYSNTQFTDPFSQG